MYVCMPAAGRASGVPDTSSSAGTSQDMGARTLPARFPYMKNLPKLLIF